jgi:hypothetical protein
VFLVCFVSLLLRLGVEISRYRFRPGLVGGESQIMLPDN